MTLRGRNQQKSSYFNIMTEQRLFTFSQCGGHSNPPVKVNASHIFTTADGNRFIYTGASLSKRRRLLPRSTESSTSRVQSLLAGPAPCKTSEYHRLVLENDTVDVWSSVTTWDLDFIRSLDSPQAVFAEVEAYKQRKNSQQDTQATTTTTPFVSAIELALAELPEQTRRLAAWIPAPSPSVVQQRVQGIRRGNVSIKYTRKEKRRIKTNTNRIWRETRRRTHHKVPDDYVFQPKITEAIVEEELEDDNEQTTNDSHLEDNGGTDDDNDLATNYGDDDSVLPPTEANDNDDNEDATGYYSDGDDHAAADDDDDDAASDDTVQLGSMYIHDPRYPSHSAVRRSCRVAARLAQQTSRG